MSHPCVSLGGKSGCFQTYLVALKLALLLEDPTVERQDGEKYCFHCGSDYVFIYAGIATLSLPEHSSFRAKDPTQGRTGIQSGELGIHVIIWMGAGAEGTYLN